MAIRAGILWLTQKKPGQFYITMYVCSFGFGKNWNYASFTVPVVVCHYRLDVLWGKPIKLIQVVATSEFHEYWWNDLEIIFLVPAAFCRASEARTQSRP